MAGENAWKTPSHRLVKTRLSQLDAMAPDEPQENGSNADSSRDL
jgi:hypothetical protein